MSASLFHSIWTVVLLLIFVGIVVWVFVVKRGSDFRQAARIPLDEDDPREPTDKDREHHG